VLLQHGRINDCKHVQPIPKWVRGPRKKELMDKNNLTECYYLVYAPVLEKTLYDVYVTLSIQQIRRCAKDLVQSISILVKNGYIHRDIHSGNVMKKGSRWFLIDYGAIYKHDWPRNDLDKEIGKRSKLSDLWGVIWAVYIFDLPIMDHVRKVIGQLPDFHKVTKYIKKDPRYKNIEKHVHISDKATKLNDKSAKLADNSLDHGYLVHMYTLLLEYDLYEEALSMDLKKPKKFQYRCRFEKECFHVLDCIKGRISIKRLLELL
jgi:serine/threonine protein kinase